MVFYKMYIILFLLLSSCSIGIRDNEQAISGSQYTMLDSESFEKLLRSAQKGNSEDARRIAGHYIGKGIYESKNTEKYINEYKSWLYRSFRMGNFYAGRELMSYLISVNSCKEAEEFFVEFISDDSIESAEIFDFKSKIDKCK